MNPRASGPAIVPGASAPLVRVWQAVTNPRAFRAFAVGLLGLAGLGVVFLDSWDGVDFWEHLAAIDALARDPLRPSDPYIAGARTSHLFTPFHLFWGIVARLTRLPAYTIAPVIGAANALLFVLGVRALARRLTGRAELATPLALVMLALWLRAPGWSGFHQLGLLPLTSIYPFWCALGLAMLGLGSLDDTRRASAGGLALRTLLVGLTFLVHPLTGSFLALALGIRALATPGTPVVGRFVHAGAVLAGLLLALAWPYFPVLGAIASAPRFASKGFAGDWRHFYADLPVRFAPLALGLPWFLGAWRKRPADWMDWTFLACVALYAVNPFTLRSPFLARYLIYVALLLQWGAVRWLAAAPEPRLAVRVLLALLVLAPLAALQVRYSVARMGVPLIEYPHGAAGRGGNRAYVERFRAFAPHLSARDVVMAGMEESWILPAVTDTRVVGVQHSNPFMDDYEDRRRAVERFFDPAASAAARAALLERYGVTRVLVPRRDAHRLAGVESLPLRFADDVYELREAPPRARRDTKRTP